MEQTITNILFIHDIISNSSGNAIDFYVCDGSKVDNTVTDGSKHNMSLVSGNVGIGTTNPGTMLQLEGVQNAYITLKNSTDENTDGGAETKIIFRDHSNAKLGQIQVSHDGTSNDTKGDFIISTHNGVSLTEALRIDSSANVGIGTTSPGTMLQLEGADAYITLKNSTAENTDGGAETKIIFEDHSDTTLAQIQVSHDGTDDDTKGDFIISTFGTSLTEALRIDSSQNVGIGTNNPSEKTEIKGNLYLNNYVDTGSARTGGKLLFDGSFDMGGNGAEGPQKIDLYDQTGDYVVLKVEGSTMTYFAATKHKWYTTSGSRQLE